MLSDRFSLEAVNCLFVYFEGHPFLNFAIMLWRVVKACLNVVLFPQFVFYMVYQEEFFQFFLVLHRLC